MKFELLISCNKSIIFWKNWKNLVKINCRDRRSTKNVYMFWFIKCIHKKFCVEDNNKNKHKFSKIRHKSKRDYNYKNSTTADRLTNYQTNQDFQSKINRNKKKTKEQNNMNVTSIWIDTNSIYDSNEQKSLYHKLIKHKKRIWIYLLII